METIDRFRGCLIGLACGDAVGTAVEFRARGSFKPVTDMVGGGPFALHPGQWTDDTSMTLCLATSLLECDGFDATDQMQRYCRWHDEGYLSSTGHWFDIGMTVADALRRFRDSGEPFSGSVHPRTAGNGCLMRLAPVPMFYFGDRHVAVEQSGQSARTTHGARECVDASRLFGAMLWLALSGANKETILLEHGITDVQSGRLTSIARGDYRDHEASAIRGSGYVVDSLETALWCFAQTDSFEEAILLATNLGDDADTTAAICGQLAGAFYGIDGIPVRWASRLTMSDMIDDLARRLFERIRLSDSGDGARTLAQTASGQRTQHDILRLGCEGGELRLIGTQRDADWEFCIVTDESALSSLIGEDGFRTDRRSWVATWDAALKELDRYPWTKMYPLFVNAAFGDAVLQALHVRATGADNDWDRWREALG